MGSGLILEFFTAKNIISLEVLGMVLFSMGSGFGGFIITLLGEMLITESSKLLIILYSLPWYEFNIRNRKLIIAFMINLQNPYSLDNGIVKLNLQFFTKFTKSLYSIATFLLQFT